MKKIKWNSIVISLVYIALGTLLVLKPEIDTNIICILLAGATILMGLVSILRYFTYDIEDRFLRNDFVTGLLIIVAGIIVFLYKDEVINLLNVALGAMILISGFEKLQDCLDIVSLGYGSPLLYVVLVLVNIGMGVMTILDIIKEQEILFVFVGVSLIYSGLTDLLSSIYLSVRRRSYSRRKLKEEEEELQSQQPINTYEMPKEENIVSAPVVDNTVVEEEQNNIQS